MHVTGRRSQSVTDSVRHTHRGRTPPLLPRARRPRYAVVPTAKGGHVDVFGRIRALGGVRLLERAQFQETVSRGVPDIRPPTSSAMLPLPKFYQYP